MRYRVLLDGSKYGEVYETYDDAVFYKNLAIMAGCQTAEIVEAKHEPYVYRVYDFYPHYIGKNNACPDKVAEEELNLNERDIRKAKQIIAKSEEFDNVYLSCNSGTYWATKDDVKSGIMRDINTINSLSHKVRAQIKKAGLEGQIKLPLLPYQRDTVNSLAEPEMPHMRGREAI